MRTFLTRQVRSTLVAIGFGVLAFAVMSNSPAFAAEPANSDLKQRFLREAPDEWQRLERAVHKYEGTFTDSETIVKLPAKSWRRRGEYFYNSDAHGTKIVLASIPDTGGRTISGSNGVYRYNVEQKSAQDKPVLRTFWATQTDYGDDATFLLQAAYIDGFPVKDFLDGPAARLVSFEPVVVEGRRLARLRFMRHFSDKSTEYSGYALLDPDFHWAVRFWQQEHGWGVMDAKLEYRTDVPDIAFPLKKTVRDIAKGAVVNIRTSEFDAPRPCSVPAAEFSLAAYGLKPPTTPRDTDRASGFATAGWVLLVLLAIGAFAAATYIRLRRSAGGRAAGH
jgi:hypothetical protein